MAIHGTAGFADLHIYECGRERRLRQGFSLQLCAILSIKVLPCHSAHRRLVKRTCTPGTRCAHLLGGDIDVWNLVLLAQDRDVRDDVNWRDVSSQDADPARRVLACHQSRTLASALLWDMFSLQEGHVLQRAIFHNFCMASQQFGWWLTP